jgi:3'(2'), 5'-bisphosphate nucleotidase
VSSPLARELRVAGETARAAGCAALRFYGDPSAQMKEGGSPVTSADYAANAVIVDTLSREFPQDAILSEESKDSAERLSARRVWIVDPLDGTKEFIARNGEFSVMVGLVVDGQPVLGAVYLPDGDVLYAAAQGTGAWVERRGQRGRLTCPPVNGGPLRLVGSRSHRDPLLATMQDALGITDVAPCGSVGVKCSRIAEGRYELYIHPSSHMREWDTCAPEVVLREAGGSVTDCRGRSLRYNKSDPRQVDGMVACAPGALGRVLRQVVPLYEQSLAERPPS